VVLDPEEFKKRVFKAAQKPALWLHSAERLRDAAEAILKHELPAEGPPATAQTIRSCGCSSSAPIKSLRVGCLCRSAAASE
jgi:hypothetical protein